MYATIRAKTDAIATEMEKIERAIYEEQDKQKTLQQLGIIRAGTWYKAEKYLYLIYPGDGFGYRRREYVGADPDKVKAALNAIKRAADYDHSKTVERHLRQKLDTIHRHLDSALYATGSSRPSW